MGLHNAWLEPKSGHGGGDASYPLAEFIGALWGPSWWPLLCVWQRLRVSSGGRQLTGISSATVAAVMSVARPWQLESDQLMPPSRRPLER